MNTVESTKKMINRPHISTIRKKSIATQFRKQWILFVFLLPAISCYLVFSYLPMLGIVAAFQDYDIVKGFFHSNFVGLKWFIEVVGDRRFPQVVSYTLLMSFSKLLITFPMPVILALLLNELVFKKFKRVIQTISYLPHFLSWVIVAIVVYRALDSYDGIINNLLDGLRLGRIDFLADSRYFIPITVLSDIWKEVGFGSIFYLAALTSIDPTLYEAAAADGAKRWRQTWHITLPGILPTAAMLFILAVGGLVNANFDQIYNLQNPMITLDTEVINTFIFRRAILDGHYSFSIAFGLVQGIVSLLLVLFSNTLSKRYADIGIY